MPVRVLKVDGMSCGNCERAVVEAVTGLAHVQKVEASATRGEVTIDHSEPAPDWSVVQSAIEDQGFDVASG